MADKRINQLPIATGATAPVPSDALAIDGATTRQTTIQVIGDTAVPVASQAEAEAGTNAAKRMTPLTTKQSIASSVGTTSDKIAAGNDSRFSGYPVAARSVLKGTDPSSFNYLYLTEGGRVGQFLWTAGDYSQQVTDDTKEAVYIASLSAPAINGAWVRKGDYETVGLNPEIFGANSSSSDNSEALQACFDLSDKYAFPISLPNKTFQFATTLIKRRLTNIRGAGMLTSVLEYTGSSDAIRVIPDLGYSDSRAFWRMTNFTVVPTTNYTAGAGIRLLLQSPGQFISNFQFAFLFLGAFGKEIGNGALAFDNSALNGDGIFKGVVNQCWINSGIRIRSGGDSLSITENTITGDGIGIYATLVDGARQLVIRNNNITARDILCYLSGVNSALIEGNWMETPSYLGNFQGAGADDGLVYLEDCNDTLILKNTIHPLYGAPGFTAAPYVVSDLSSSGVNGRDNIVDYNQIGNGQAGDFRVTSKNFKIGPSNNFITGARDFLVSPAVNSISGLLKTPTLLNSWASGSFGTPKYFKDLNGDVTFYGSMSGGSGTCFVLPVGYRPANNVRFSVPQTSTTATLQVSSSGSIDIAAATGNTEISLNGIRFRALPA